ncbi:DUF6340 family protein [Pontibacter vulgaris]|uniref:DUF6340 family protein n=1 Tax=Pontibacter vulgaris TaxID=2905679 RepID=UPI001FA70C48|nr:DUF6340 family protein [Pontibacter vulgaris]
MRKLLLKTGLYFILTALLFSCTSQLIVETTKPPVVTVLPEQWKVVVLNNFDAKLLSTKKDSKVETYRQGALAAFDGVVNAVIDDSTFVLVHADSAFRGSASTSWNVLNREQILQLYKAHPYHLLVVLDNFETFFEQEIERSDEGNKTAHYTLNTHTGWTLYDSTGIALDQVILTNNTLYNSRSVISGLLAVGPSLTNATPTIESLAYETGQSYWQRFYPQRTYYSRIVYAPQAFVDGVTYMHQQNWDKAIAVFKPFTSNKNRRLAGKAAYNLAIIYEALGNVTEAKKWADEAAERKNPMAPYLVQHLKQKP